MSELQTEFPDYPLLLKQAVSLGRLLLDPLIEYCHMCNIDQDVLCISYHPLQTEINKVGDMWIIVFIRLLFPRICGYSGYFYSKASTRTPGFE